jgi:high mobility group protein B3
LASSSTDRDVLSSRVSQKSRGSDDEDSGKKKGGQKRKRGADGGEKKARKPQAKSAYFFYLDDARPKFMAEHPEMRSNMIGVTQALAAQWKELSESEKAPYIEKNAQAKAELAALGSDDEGAAASSSKTKKRSTTGKDGKPKAPPVAQKLWEADYKKELKSTDPKLTTAEVNQKCKDTWKAMSEEERQPWVEKHLPMKRQYNLDLAAWKKKQPKEGEEASSGAAADGDDAEEEKDDAAGGADEEEDEDAKAEREKERKARKEAKKAKKEAKKSKKEKKEKVRCAQLQGDRSVLRADFAASYLPLFPLPCRRTRRTRSPRPKPPTPPVVRKMPRWPGRRSRLSRWRNRRTSLATSSSYRMLQTALLFEASSKRGCSVDVSHAPPRFG